MERMFTEVQRLYIEEVLGTSPAHYQALGLEAVDGAPIAPPDESAAQSAIIRVLILTPRLEPEEQSLLVKILASIQLENYSVIEIVEPDAEGSGSAGDLPAARAVLAFLGAELSSNTGPGVRRWNLPRLSQMLSGPATDIAAHKKETWTRLKQFRRENRT